MEVERDPDGTLVCRNLSAFHVDTLVHLPGLLTSQDDRVRDRLLPRTYEADEDEDQWRRYGVPDLEHLFASRVEIINKDLESLAQDGAVTFSLKIPERHTNAWVSSLNAARLALFVLHELEEADMEREPDDLADFEKELAVVRIHVLAFMQELLLESGSV